MNLVYGLIVLILVIALAVFSSIAFKRSRNSKLCKSGYYCIFRGPDEAWGEILECKGNILQAPIDKKRKKGAPAHKWPTGGYQVPTDMKIPYMMYPLNASPQTQCPVGVLIFDIGNPIPLNYKNASDISPEVIEAIAESNLAVKVFKDWAEMLGEDEAQLKSKRGNIFSYITIALIAACLILLIINFIGQSSINNHLKEIMDAFGV